MKKKLILSLALAALLLSALPVEACAIGPYPPTLTVIVYGAPKDLQMRVVLQYEGQPLSCPMEREHRAWETMFRLYRDGVSIFDHWHGNGHDFRGAVLLLISGGEERSVPIPDGLLKPRGYDEVLTLRYADGSLTYGFTAWRAPLLIGMRVLAALLIEGLFFRLSGFTERKSWLMFLAINIVIHGALNALCYGRFNLTDPRYPVAFFITILLSFLAELCAFLLLVDEYDSDRLTAYLLKANLASHAFNNLLISFLPM